MAVLSVWLSQHGLVSDAMVASTHLRFAGNADAGVGELPTEQQLAEVLSTFVLQLATAKADENRRAEEAKVPSCDTYQGRGGGGTVLWYILGRGYRGRLAS